MTTAQLLIVSLTAFAIVLTVAYTRRSIRRAELYEDLRRAELEHTAKIRRQDRELAAPVAGDGPAVGAVLAVHVDGRVIRGNLAAPIGRRVVLTDAQVVKAGSDSHELGGVRQHIPMCRVTQIQEF